MTGMRERRRRFYAKFCRLPCRGLGQWWRAKIPCIYPIKVKKGCKGRAF